MLSFHLAEKASARPVHSRVSLKTDTVQSKYGTIMFCENAQSVPHGDAVAGMAPDRSVEVASRWVRSYGVLHKSD